MHQGEALDSKSKLTKINKLITIMVSFAIHNYLVKDNS